MSDKAFNENLIKDVNFYRDEINEYGHDADKMEELFTSALLRYADKIQGFTEEIAVMSPYDGPALKAEIYRRNISLFIRKLENFRDNGFSNDGLRAFSIKNEPSPLSGSVLTDMAEIRLEISRMEDISPKEREEILDKLEEMENIFSAEESRYKKWDMLRPYFMWLSGKKLKVAILILPLFFKLR